MNPYESRNSTLDISRLFDGFAQDERKHSNARRVDDNWEHVDGDYGGIS